MEVTMSNLFLKQQIFTNIFYLSNRFQISANEIDEEITMRQWMTLITIAHLPPNNTSYNRIAEQMGCTKQNAKQLVSKLVEKKFVHLEKNITDPRAVNVVIDESGLIIMKAYFTKANELLSKVFNSLNESELDILWNLLKKLLAEDSKEWIGFEHKIFGMEDI